MSIFDNILARLGYKRELEKVQRWQSEAADAQQWEMPSWEVYANQADLYRLSPALGTAVDILARTVGTTKFNVKRMVGEDERDIPNHEFERLLRNPNPLQTKLELFQYTVSNFLLNGNAIWWLNYNSGGRVDEIWTMPFSKVKPIPDGRLYISHYEYSPGMGKPPIRFETKEIVHFKAYNPNNDFVGLSPVEALAVTVSGDLAMRRTNTRAYAEYGGAPQSILAFKDFVPNEQWSNIKDETRQAAKKNEMMMLRGVGDGVTWLQRQLTNKDMQYIEGLRSNFTDVFNRLCPGLLAMLDPNSTEANALAARATFADYTLFPMLELIGQKITADILYSYGRNIIGEFEDPRVVDKRLKLDEQEAFERSHTLEEVRKLYYGDDPLGDERDKKLMSEAKANPFGQQDDDEDANPVNMSDETDTEDTTVKAAITDLMRWRRMAERGRTEKVLNFKSEVIPSDTMAAIKTRLPMLDDPKNVLALFDRHISALQPKPKVDPLLVLKGIELGVKALERTR